MRFDLLGLGLPGLLAVALSACSGAIGGTSGGGTDASVPPPSDARPNDATAEVGPADANAARDAATADARTSDATTDAGRPDALPPPPNDAGLANPGFPPVSIQPGGIVYWDTSYFANALYSSEGWVTVTPNGDEPLRYWNDPQFDDDGWPLYLVDGQPLKAIVYGLHVGEKRNHLARGHVVLTWTGRADVRLNRGGEYLRDESSTVETGMATDGRRVYRFTNVNLSDITVEDIDPSNPPKNIRIWLPDPDDPQNRSLENEFFHPVFLDRMRDEKWGVARFMDWLHTNASPVSAWSDRRRPTYAFMVGVLNPRPPHTGFPANHGTGAAYEVLIRLCNEIGVDLWLNVPHLANDDHIEKLGRLVRWGSDGVEPYSGPVANPVFPGLRPDLKVYVEFSNEIWSWGGSFPQGHWAFDRGRELGLTKEVFNARRFSEVWSIFQRAFDDDARLVRVAAVFSALDSYTLPFLSEIARYGPTLDPPVEPDVIAPTTYFGNGIQNYVHAQPWLNSVDEAYWTSPQHESHLNAAFDEWMRRLLSGDAQEGAGPDATGVGGGFGEWLHEAALTTFSTPKPLVAYEGGPSIYTDQMENEDPVKGPLVTQFMGALNRHPRMADVYRTHLHMAHSRGLRSHAPFVLVSQWSKWGQWGHLEYLDQPPEDSVKYTFLRNWVAEASTFRPVDEPQDAVPSFRTDHILPAAPLGESYQSEIDSAGGNGDVRATILATHLAPGLRVDPVDGAPGRLRVSGSASAHVTSYIYAIVRDADGDVGRRTFTLRVVGGPGTVVESDFTGSDPGLNLPWTATYARQSDIGWSGWIAGPGLSPGAGDNAILYTQTAPADFEASTLALSVDRGHYLSATLTPPAGGLDLRSAEVSVAVRRYDDHAARRYAVMTSLGGFTAGSEVFASEQIDATSEVQLTFTLPQTAAYASVDAPLEIRIYGFRGQYASHRTSLTAFKLTVAP